MPPKLLETKHDLDTRFSVVLILKKHRKAKWNQQKQKKPVDCYSILSNSNYVILFVQTTKLNVLNS